MYKWKPYSDYLSMDTEGFFSIGNNADYHNNLTLLLIRKTLEL